MENTLVFQAEIFVNNASLALLEVQIKDEPINFYISDSAIMALKSYTVKDKSIEERKTPEQTCSRIGKQGEIKLNT